MYSASAALLVSNLYLMMRQTHIKHKTVKEKLAYIYAYNTEINYLRKNWYKSDQMKL